MINITPQQLRKAADIQEKIQALQEELGQLLGGEASTPATTETPPTRGRGKRRKMSAEGLANIRAGVAKRMAAKGKVVKRAKKKFSTAGRAALSAAIKARWAKAKAAGRSKL